MESKEKKTGKKKPRAWHYPNGVKTRYTAPKPEKLSALGVWLKEHPDGIGEILDMKAVMK